jgi:hypothetical protein
MTRNTFIIFLGPYLCCDFHLLLPEQVTFLVLLLSSRNQFSYALQELTGENALPTLTGSDGNLTQSSSTYSAFHSRSPIWADVTGPVEIHAFSTWN